MQKIVSTCSLAIYSQTDEYLCNFLTRGTLHLEMVTSVKPKSVIRSYMTSFVTTSYFYYFLLPFFFYKASDACFLLEIARYYSQKSRRHLLS